MDKPNLIRLYDYLGSQKEKIRELRESLPGDMTTVLKHLRESQLQILMAMDDVKQQIYPPEEVKQPETTTEEPKQQSLPKEEPKPEAPVS
jgi:hypothetical protein